MDQLKDFLLEIYNLLYSEYGPQGWWPADNWFEVIVGAVLTQNTSWKNVEKAIQNLKLKNFLEPERLYKLSEQELAHFIRPAGFYNLKARRLKNLIELLRKYDFDFKKTAAQIKREELLSVNGIGKETADSILLYAFDKPIFVVDNYTRRLLQRLGVVCGEADYEEIQSLFHRISSDLQCYKEYHALIVRHVKQICLKNKPKCGDCCIGMFCKYSILSTKN